MTDDELMARLSAAAAEFDPTPDQVLAAGRAALLTRRLDEELVALVADSELAGAGQVRATGADVRLLAFETADVSLELQVEFAGARAVIRGLVTGASGEAVIEVAGERHVAPIEEGWFTATDLPAGATRVRVTTARGPVVTSWVHLQAPSAP